MSVLLATFFARAIKHTHTHTHTHTHKHTHTFTSYLLVKHISTVEKLDRNETLKEKVREKLKQTCIPLTLAYHRFCPNISKVIQKHWNLLEINESLKEIFNYQQITAFRQNKNLKELIGSHKIAKNEVKK